MSVVSVRIDGDVAVVTLDSPPVNMGSHQLRSELFAAVQEIAAMPSLVGVVLASGGRHFYSGSDISEFDGPIRRPGLPDVIALIDALPVPVVVALKGLTLGGGLELALGCDVRLAEPQAKVGFPETALGILPGAGGTVRLPRAIGVPEAIGMIASARVAPAQEAANLGLVDEIVPAERLLERAVAVARIAEKRRLRTLSVPDSDPAAVEAAVVAARRNDRARPNVLRAVELVRSGAELDGDSALVRERAAFDELRVSEEARNLRYLFFAKRAAARDLETSADAPALSTIGIGGAGTMGAGIAESCLRAGFDVILFDVSPKTLARASTALHTALQGVERCGSLTTAGTLEALVGSDLVIDAVFEEIDIKVDFLTSVQRIVGEDVVLASNTSYLDLDLMGSRLAVPETLAGLHFFNPAARNRLVEVVRTERASERTMAALTRLMKRLGKVGIPARVGEGFIANRVYADYRAQAEFLVEDGAAPEQVDAAMVALGLPIGPFMVGDMSGLDIAWMRRKRLAATRDPRQRYVEIPDRLCEAGRLGRKTGAGWYSYPDGAARGVVDPAVREIIDAARDAKGLVARHVSSAEIQQRILCSMLLAAATVVTDGVARRASDIDLAFTEGFAFPTWLGGPLRYCSSQRLHWLLEGLAAAHASDPIGFASARSAAEGRLPVGVARILDAVR